MFNDTLNTFYIWLYGIRHMVKTTEIIREKTSCHHYIGYSFHLPQGFFYMYHLRQDSTAFVTPVVKHRLERVIAQCVDH